MSCTRHLLEYIGCAGGGRDKGRGVANFGKIFEKSEIGVQIFFFTWGFFFHHQGAKKQCFVAFPSQSQAVVGDIRKNGQTFSDLNFHKI